MGQQPENPSAFPAFEEIDQWDKDAEKYREAMLPVGGMTLRDYFAAKVCANIAEYVAGIYYNVANENPDAATAQAATVAKTAYVLADAMLAERAK